MRPPSSRREPQVGRVGWGFVATYALAYMSIALMLIAPLLVTLALKVKSLVGVDQAPSSLALVTGVGGLLSLVGNPLFGRLSDRTSSSLGMRRPWMVGGLAGGCFGILVVAVAPSIPVVLVGWCLAQLFFSALQSALVAVLPDQVPVDQRGAVSGVLGVAVPTASVVGTFLVQLFTGHQVAMFLVPCAIGGFFVLLFVATLDDRRLAPEDRAAVVGARLPRGVLLQPAPEPGPRLGLRRTIPLHLRLRVPDDVPGLLPDRPDRQRRGRRAHARSSSPPRSSRSSSSSRPWSVAGSRTGRGRRKVFVVAASTVYGVALFVVAVASDFNGFLVGMAIGGLGFGMYMAVDLALVTDVLPDSRNAAKDLGVFNMANALPYAFAPAVAPAILAASGGSYGVLYAVAGFCAILGALAIVPIRGVR